MTENPLKNEDLRPPREKLCEEDAEKDENAAGSEDRQKRSYYYDDAHGYEIYAPDEDEEEDSD